jgi:hypothetical protein
MLWENYGYEVGKTDVLNAGGILSIPGDGAFGACESAPGDPEHPAADAGEITKPGNIA